MHGKLCHGEPGNISADHDDVAVGKVEQGDDTIHHAVAQRDQSIDRAGLQTVDDLP
ncbi:hypothetical protein SDC9_128396 [bioreactor metagenome]|uniref:Uncharacterized protein n=1 Tax=bioreactor metagenome TaxID=1076179 RepID=A0A645CWP2_9ZZZZ